MKSEWVDNSAQTGRGKNDTDSGEKSAGRGLLAVTTVLFLVAMFFLGRSIAGTVQETEAASSEILHSENWGLGFGQEGTQPTGNVTADKLKEYNAYYVGDSSEKVIYLTFDCGYENGNTEAILDALKKHGVSATFFVVGHYLESAPELVKRMVEDA